MDLLVFYRHYFYNNNADKSDEKMKKFYPNYSITDTIARALVRIEECQQAVTHLPITPRVLMKLRQSARLCSIHYSTKIEGNRLTREQVERVVKKSEHFPGRERDEAEVKGYYAALDALEKYVAKNESLNERFIQILHALVMAGGRTNVKPGLYRDGQNVIRDGVTGRIVYLPPQADDVASLMKEFVTWINGSSTILAPIVAGIAHYQFVTIHPYFDGNGRTARLLTTLLLYLRGYDLKGLYALEEYYARDLAGYYAALTIGLSHNYYEGRAQADITTWVEYFCQGMLQSFEKVRAKIEEEVKPGIADQSKILRTLDPKQRKVLELFQQYQTVTANQVGELFGFKPRTSRELCRKWCQKGFLVAVDPSRKGRKYQLAQQFTSLVE
jgi:Fic family protein